MKTLFAKTRIEGLDEQGRKYIIANPGDVFTEDDDTEADILISVGAADEVDVEATLAGSEEDPQNSDELPHKPDLITELENKGVDVDDM